jgi:2-dehydropantoate 2-reductase
MKCCVVGAGAIGGHLAVKLRRAGHEVAVIARGPQLAAIRAAGLVLEQGGQALHANVRAAEGSGELGVQDVVFVTTKATALASVVPLLPPLVGSATRVVFIQNGITWWYPLGLPAAHPRPAQVPVFALAERFLAFLRPEQVLAGVIYSANEVLRPGVIRNNSPVGTNVVELGAPDDGDSAPLRALRSALEAAGIAAPPIAQIRASLWRKLVLNASSSSLCVAVENPAAIATDARVQETMLRMLHECLAIAAAHGYDVAPGFDFERWTQRRTAHKPSMLQDFEARRPMEIGEIVLAPLAFARAAGLATPTLDAVGAIAARRAIDQGLYTPA